MTSTITYKLVYSINDDLWCKCILYSIVFSCTFKNMTYLLDIFLKFTKLTSRIISISYLDNVFVTQGHVKCKVSVTCHFKSWLKILS